MKRDDLAARVEHWRQRLAPEWRITLKDSGPDWKHEEDYLGTVQSDDDYQHAKLHITDAALEQSDEDVDLTIVHELIHPLLREMRSALDRLEAHVPKPAWQIVSDQFGRDEEQVADRLSRLIVHADRQQWPAFGTMAAET